MKLSQLALVVGVGLPTHARNNLLLAQDGHVLPGSVLDATVRVCTSPGIGFRAVIADSNASVASRLAGVRFRFQPTTLRENPSSTSGR